MIQIIGDTFEELADLQTLIETGKLNYHEKKIKVYAMFKLSSGGTLYVDQYNHIVGCNEPYKDFRSMNIYKAEGEDK